MREPLDHMYFNWLCAKVVNIRELGSSPTHWKLFTILQKTEFVWLISGDDNRAKDGKELRLEFIFQAEIPDDPEWRLNIPCSVFEMLIAFARRAEFQNEMPVQDWFWEFLDNLGLSNFNDDSGYDVYDVDDILEEFIWRTYEPNGDGGLFPIEHPLSDQREIEIWYQFCEYLVDQNRLP